MSDPLLAVESLSIYATAGGVRRPIVRDLNLSIAAGETVGIVGESGSGKSLTARIVMHLPPSGILASGSVRYRGDELMTMPEERLRGIRGRQISMLLQDPFTMLNPLMKAGAHIEEMLPGGRRARESRRADALRRLAEVGIHDPGVADRYPFQLSGGMRQRVALASAIAGDPDLLVADEPTTALDVTTQAEILELLRTVQSARGMGMLLITHDLRVAFSVCDRVYVLYAGTVLETAPAAAARAEPLHPYTVGLLVSEPPVDRRVAQLRTIEGSVPQLSDVAGGCPYAPRCRWSQPRCTELAPELRELDPGRWTACVRVEEIRGELAAERRLAERAAPTPAPVTGPEPLLRVSDLAKRFRVGRADVEAVRGVSLELRPGESVGLVGESGSGKTTLGRCIVGLEQPDAGTIALAGIDASRRAQLGASEHRALRRTAQMIFQDPYSSLDPSQTIAAALREVLELYPGPERQEVDALLERVGLAPAHGARRPAALSGGERQRAAIARALAVNPRLLVCDEPVSALDVSVQGQILRLFRTLQAELGLGYLFITHDFAVVRQVVDRVYVMYRGEIVESGPVDTVLDSPSHPYTRRLVASIPGQSEPGVTTGAGSG